MLKEKKSTFKPVKKPQEDSSSEEQRVRQKKFGDSSSSEIPKRRNMKPRCLMIRLRSAREVAEEGERPVLTERREDAPIATPEVEVTTENAEKTEEMLSSSTTIAVKERSRGFYASEASRPMTLEEMFERQREEERNTPEYLAEAERSHQESKRWYIEHCRRKGVPHELENEPETLPQSEIAKFRAKTAETVKSILAALTRRRKNTKETPPKSTSSRIPLNSKVVESKESHS